jgi:type III secretory pathway component EscV
MNLAEMAADIQIDEDAQQEARTVIQELANLVGIPAYEVHIEETHNDDGTVDVHIETVEVKQDVKPKLTVISNDNMDKGD